MNDLTKYLKQRAAMQSRLVPPSNSSPIWIIQVGDVVEDQGLHDQHIVVDENLGYWFFKNVQTQNPWMLTKTSIRGVFKLIASPKYRIGQTVHFTNQPVILGPSTALIASIDYQSNPMSGAWGFIYTTPAGQIYTEVALDYLQLPSPVPVVPASIQVIPWVPAIGDKCIESPSSMASLIYTIDRFDPFTRHYSLKSGTTTLLILQEALLSDYEKYELPPLSLTQAAIAAANSVLHYKEPWAVPMSTFLNCQHEWVVSAGFSRTYHDCKHCKAKREDVDPTFDKTKA